MGLFDPAADKLIFFILAVKCFTVMCVREDIRIIKKSGTLSVTFLYLRYYFQKLFKLGSFFIGKFADKLDKLLLFFAEAPLRKSTLIVGQPCDIIKAYVIVFCKHYGTFKGDLGITQFIFPVMLR